MSLFKEIADIQTAETLNLPTPDFENINVVVKPSEVQEEMVKSLGERADRIRSGSVDASTDNMLKITNEGRKLALDQRLMNPLLIHYYQIVITVKLILVAKIYTEYGMKMLIKNRHNLYFVIYLLQKI